MDTDVKKTVLITGCGGRLGKAFIENFSNHYNIVGISSKEQAQSNYTHIKSDLSNFIGIIKTLPKIDCIINNAAHYNIHDPKTYPGGILEEFYVNVVFPYEFSCHMYNVWKNMDGYFSILNISSVASINFYNINQTSYAMCKTSMNRMTVDLNRSFMPKVRVNAIAPNSFPAYTKTENLLNMMSTIIDNDIINGQIIVMDA